MRPRDQALAQRLAETVNLFDKNKHSLLGVQTPESFGVFIEQLLESIHRVKYVPVLQTRVLSKKSADPDSDMFDPVKAAILQQRDGNIDEAFWLVFLLTHFGRHRLAGWWYVQQVYGRLGDGSRWTWDSVINNPDGFRQWLNDNQGKLQSGNTHHGFGNHRKRESLDAYSRGGTGAIVTSYVTWAIPYGSHENLIQDAYRQVGDKAEVVFDYLFQSMDAITRFGRTARFDYLTMIGHMALANIKPGKVYLVGATGPKYGAKLLFMGDRSAKIPLATLESWLSEFAVQLGVGMQELEDALCNWQKSPEVFRKYRG